MTSVDASRRLVRPGFLKWSMVVFVLLLPFVVHAIWDYVEQRRVNARVDAIVRNGEPITTFRYIQLSADAADADRFYRAASALVIGVRYGAAPLIGYRIGVARRDGTWTPELIDELRPQLEQQQEALALVDRAASLPFDEFMVGATFNYLTSGLTRLSLLCEIRALARAMDGDGDGALESYYASVRMARATQGVPPPLSGLKIVLDRSRPSPAARARLAAAIADLDRDDRIAETFIRERAMILGETSLSLQRPRHWEEVVLHPWLVHQLVKQLDAYAAVIAAAKKPVADRLSAIASVGTLPGRRNPTGNAKSLAATIERVHCARQLVAGEVVNCQP